MAYVIAQAVLRRLAETGRAPDTLAAVGPYLPRSPAERDGGYRLSELPLTLAERPAIAASPRLSQRTAAVAGR